MRLPAVGRRLTDRIAVAVAVVVRTPLTRIMIEIDRFASSEPSSSSFFGGGCARRVGMAFTQSVRAAAPSIFERHQIVFLQ